LTGVRVQGLSHIDLEALILGAGTMISKIEAFLDEGVDVDRPMLARSFARVQQHVLDDGVRALAVLNDLVEVVEQGVRQLGDFTARFIITRHSVHGFPQFVPTWPNWMLFCKLPVLRTRRAICLSVKGLTSTW